MPRPKGGYALKSGEKVPGTTSITNRFRESGGLIQWAYNCGLEGIDMGKARDSAADAGSCCHAMIDAHIHNRKFEKADWDKAAVAKAEHAFLAYLHWAEQRGLVVTASELSLVSEHYGFGGTLDGAIDPSHGASDSITLIDYKSSNGIYVENLLQMGAYAVLWEENFPDRPVVGVQILRVTKPAAPDDPVSFHHHWWSAEILPLIKSEFLLLREAYGLDKRIKAML